MRAVFLVAALLLAACSQPAPSAAASSPTQSTQATARPCKLPVYWSVNTPSPTGFALHTGFVSVPDGAVSEAGVPSPLPGAYGATYDSSSRKWMRVDRSQLSPDRSRYTHWTGSPGTNEVHVVNIASRADRVAYSGSVLYIPIAFESDAIYLVQGVQIRQGVFEKLYRLDPAGGTPTLVPGSDRHMNQYGWVLISDGAAWGIDDGVQGNNYTYSVLRLDLASSQVTSWIGPLSDFPWPLGTDSRHNLYVQTVNQNSLWRVASPGQAARLANPGPIRLGDFVGGPGVFESDSLGAWFAGQGGVWLYDAGGEPKQFKVGAPGDDVWPAGPCT